MLFFFFNDTATTEIYTLSLHDALPISALAGVDPVTMLTGPIPATAKALKRSGLSLDEIGAVEIKDRKSTRLNSSHANISYAVFCLKKQRPTLARTAICRRMLSPVWHIW